MISHLRTSLIALVALAAGCSVGTGLGSNPGSTSSTTPTASGAGADPAYVVLPDLTGLTEAEARQRLAEAGVTGNIYTRDNTGCEQKMEIAAGMVCGQQPRAGSRQSARLAVTLELARSTERGGAGTSTEWVKMPNVVGMTVEQATAVLKEAGFTEIRVQQRVDADCRPDVVCKQNPEAGSQGRLSLPKTLFVGAP